MSEESPKKKSNLKQILAGVSELNKQQITEVFVPSVGDVINFKPLTVKQQKQILSSSVDTEIENLSFSNTMNEIILENCLSSPGQLKTTDKPLILLQLRRKAVGNELTVPDGDELHIINIEDHVESVKKSITENETTFNVEIEGVTITGSVPDLETDTKYNKQFTKKIKSGNKNKLNLTDVVGDIYIHEMVKYVKSIKIGEDSLDIDDSITVEQTINVFESLPMKISNAIASQIKRLRQPEIASLTNDNLPADTQISIDGSLFTSD